MKTIQKLEKPLEEYNVFTSPKTGKEINIKDIVARVDFVRGSVYSHNACFGALLDNLNFIYTFDIPTQATDGTRLFINPEWTEMLSDAEIRFVMIHELLHCVFNHMKRSIQHESQLSNIAADFEVNGAAYLDKFVTTGQMDHIGSMFSDKYIKGSCCTTDLWSYEAIYKDLKKNGFTLNAPYLDIIWPAHHPVQDDMKGIHTSREWKAGHKDCIHKINKILSVEYSKISEHCTPDEIANALEKSIPTIANLKGSSHNKKDFSGEIDTTFIDAEYIKYEQGWDYCVDESINSIQQILFLIDLNTQTQITNSLKDIGIPTVVNPNTQKIGYPATDPSEERLNIPMPPKGNAIGGSGGSLIPLSKEDIISQQEGTNIARQAGYKGEFTKETQQTEIEDQWNENIEKFAGKEGSSLIIRHILDSKSSNYNWQYELRKLLNYSMNNSTRYRNEWGEKRGLARDSMTLKHKSNNNSMKDIVFLVDCSGSISNDMLSDILSECYSISRKCNIKDITYAYFTTKVELVETNCAKLAGRLSDMAVMILKDAPRGGHITGGTNFKNALDWVNNIGGARCVIILTDGYDTPIVKPCKVKNLIWVVYDNMNFKSADSSRVINLNTNQSRNPIGL